MTILRTGRAALILVVLSATGAYAAHSATWDDLRGTTILYSNTSEVDRRLADYLFTGLQKHLLSSFRERQGIDSARTGSFMFDGDVVEIGSATDELEIGESIGSVRETIDARHLRALANGSITTDEGTTTYRQFLRFDDAANSIQSSGFVGTLLSFQQEHTLFEYELRFDNGLETNVDTNGTLEDLEETVITVLGKQYLVFDPQIDGNKFAMNLFGGGIEDTLAEHETRTYIINNAEYEITPLAISDPANDHAEVVFNGPPSEKTLRAKLDEISGDHP